MAAEHRTVDAAYWIATTPRTGYPPPQRRHDRRRRLAKVGLHIEADRPNVLIHVVATDDVDEGLCFGDPFGGLLKVFRGWQHLKSAAASNQRPESTSSRERLLYNSLSGETLPGYQ
ncbi:hypothetical protein [Streptomyces sp. NPDC001966]